MENIQRICELVQKHQNWRSSCLNMIASESVTSPLVETILASDFSRRYFGEGYSGDKIFEEIFDLATHLAEELFDAEYADIRPVTGNVAGLAVITSLVKPGDKIITLPGEYGGYPLGITGWANIDVLYHPFDPEVYNIKVDEAKQQILEQEPNVVVLGMSQYIFPHPVGELAKAAHQVGAKIWYDGAHVMGLIAGKSFHNPLKEGADILTGSTHKTLPGPQRGIVLTNKKEIRDKLDAVLGHSPVFLVSCIHNNTAAALAVALAEFKEFGEAYAKQVVKNAQALGKALLGKGIPLLGSEHGITQTHQVIIKTPGSGSEKGLEIKEKLEEAGITSDGIPRLGVQEVTRLGMKEAEMKKIARFIADVILDRRPLAEVREDTRSLASGYQKIHYSFQDGEEAYSLIAHLL